MQADFSIECGADDEYLEIPWASEDDSLRYVDLKLNPEGIVDLDEARRFRELAEFLLSVNSPTGAFQTAKCDAGFTRELTPEDEDFETTGKFWSYVDLFLAPPAERPSFERNHSVAQRLVSFLRRTSATSAAADFLVRRAWFTDELLEDGFYITCYVFGYSDEEYQARKNWAAALRLVGDGLSSDLVKHI